MNYTIDIYRLNVTSATFEKIDEITTFMNLEYSNQLNGFGGAIFDMAVQDQKLTKANFHRYRNHVAIKREGVIVYFGTISNLFGEYEDINGKVHIESVGYFAHLKNRFTALSRVFTSTDQSTIAWNLIDESQLTTNGSLAITRGAYTTSVSRDRTYEYGSLSSAISGLSNTNIRKGFDFDFTPVLTSGLVTSIAFNTYYPVLGNVRNDLATLRLGDNIKNLDFKTIGNLVNTTTSIGQGVGTDSLKVTGSYPASQLAYSRREQVDKYSDVSVLSTLTEKNTAVLEDSSAEGYGFNLSLFANMKPSLGEYSLGDTLNYDIVVPDAGDYINFVGQNRVTEINVRVDDQGVETVTPKLEVIG